VNVRQSPQPRLDFSKLNGPDQMVDGKYQTRFGLSLDNASTVGKLHVEAHAPSVESANLYRADGGSMTEHWTGAMVEGAAFSGLDGPPSQLILDVITENPEPTIELRWKFF
jgi:hypothetical protein